MWQILKYLPRKALSRLTGTLVHWKGPRWFVEWEITIFAAMYHINLAEAELAPSEYESLGEFFVRRLKPGIRPLAAEAVVHPADSRILQSGLVEEGGQCVQAKGLKYKLQEFLVDPHWKDKYANGFFVTYYLCPTDYHRVHSPVAGFITKVTYVPGDLWPVHDDAVGSIESLYAVNERVIVEIATDLGSVAVVFVGATNVGSIGLAFDRGIQSNRGLPFVEKAYPQRIEIRKGDELGWFRMGSTVVVVYSEEYRKRFYGSLKIGPVVKVNAALVSG